MTDAIASRLRDLARVAERMALAVECLPPDSPATFAACRAACVADDSEAELRILADSINSGNARQIAPEAR